MHRTIPLAFLPLLSAGILTTATAQQRPVVGAPATGTGYRQALQRPASGFHAVAVPPPAPEDAASIASLARSVAPGAAPRSARPTAPAVASWGTMIGKTTYDLQSNRSTANRMAMSGNTLSAVWTQTCALGSGPGFTNRGIGYNLTTTAGSSFLNGPNGNCPSNFGIATQRTGWPEVAHVGSNEFVVAHTGSGLVTTRRPLGSGAWPTASALCFTASTDGGIANGTWPRLVSSGNTLHLVYCSSGSLTVPQAPSGVINPILYARSTDGGVSWDRQNVLLPGMDSLNFSDIGGDQYAIGVNGNTVAIAAGAFGRHTVIWKSTDNGATFTQTIIQPDFTNADTVALPTNTGVVASDGAMSVVVDDGGTVHFFTGTQLVAVAQNPITGRWKATGTYFPNVVDALLYWNDRELASMRLNAHAPGDATNLRLRVAGVDPICPAVPQFTPCTLAVASTANGGTQPYSVTGASSMPTAVTDANGDVYCIYAGGRIGTSNSGDATGQYFRDLYLLRLSFSGSSVTAYNPKNISRDIKGVFNGAAANSEESVFPSAVHTVVNNRIHYQWMSDFEPGNSVQPATPGPDLEVESAIMYDNINVAALTWTTPTVLTATACTLATPTIVANSPTCGGTLTLSATGVPAGVTYQWSGPNGFSSRLAAPTRSGLTAAAAGIYQLTITNSTCSASATRSVLSTAPSATFSYPACSYCRQGGASPLPSISGTPGGTFSASPTGLSLNATTGAINLLSSSAGTYTVTYSVVAGTCSATRTQTITVSAGTAQAGFSYSLGASCAGSPTTLTPTLAAGATAGTFAATPAGLTLNPATGDIALATSAPGTYTITNTLAGGTGTSCAGAASTTLTLSAAPAASFAYASSTYCLAGADPAPTITGTSGGLFSATPAGLSLNPLTGQITLSTSTTGTYQITYAIGGSCPASATQTLTLATNPTSTFTYPTGVPLCAGAASTLAPTLGTGGALGVFTATPAGLSINSQTGVVNLSASVAGSYTVTNTISSSGGCAASTTNRTLVLAAQPTATVVANGATTFCQGGSVTLTASGGTTYLWSNGLTTPSITVSAAGAYTVTASNGGCQATSLPLTVTVNPAPAATLTASGSTSICQGATLTLVASGAGVGGTYQFLRNGVVISGATGTSYQATLAGTYTVTATSAAGCSATSPGMSVTVVPQSTAAFTFAQNVYCQSGAGTPTPTVTGTPGGTFVAAPTGLSLNATTGAINLAASTPGFYNITYAVGGQCPASASRTLTITAAPTATFAYNYPTGACAGTAQPALPTLAAGASAGTFSASPAGLVFVTNSPGWVNLAQTTPGTYTITNQVTPTNGCAAVSATATLTVLPGTTAAITGLNASYCSTDAPVTLQGLVNGQPAPVAFTIDLQPATQLNPATLSPGPHLVNLQTLPGQPVCPASVNQTVTINVTPPQPSITAQPQSSGIVILTSSAFTGNQWYLNGTAIPGATNRTYAVTAAAQNGAYSVLVTGGTGCVSAPSATFNAVVNGTAAPLAGPALGLVPNPTADGFVTLTLPAQAQPVTVEVLDGVGRTVYRLTVPATATEQVLDLRTLPAAVYAVRVAGTATRRLVRQ